MSFSKSYAAPPSWRRSRGEPAPPRPKPYADWVQHGRPPDVVFQYREHGLDSSMHAYFLPHERLVHIDLDLDYYFFQLVAELRVDAAARLLHVERIVCETRNMWPEAMRAAPREGTGGMALFKSNAAFLGDWASLHHVVREFFGPGWGAASLPLTRPRPSEEAVALAKGSYERMGSFCRGPWREAVATYFRERIDAAITVQKHFRAWRVRLAVTFNPNTPLGRCRALREFEQLLSVRSACVH